MEQLTIRVRPSRCGGVIVFVTAALERAGACTRDTNVSNNPLNSTMLRFSVGTSGGK
ncbi:hypothetical protein PSAC2689_10199 [Paraburkholderia sacchari]